MSRSIASKEAELLFSNDHLVYRTITIPTLNWIVNDGVAATGAQELDPILWRQAFSGAVTHYAAYLERNLRANIRLMPEHHGDLAYCLARHWEKEHAINRLEGIVNEPIRLNVLALATQHSASVLRLMEDQHCILAPTIKDPRVSSGVLGEQNRGLIGVYRMDGTTPELLLCGDDIDALLDIYEAKFRPSVAPGE
jgi:hypothetical protein